MERSPLWTLSYKGLKPEEEGLREALCTLGNGYFAVRGAAPEFHADDNHCPGMYMAGLFNKVGTKMGGRIIYNEDFVNCPNWLYLTFKIDDGDWFKPAPGQLMEYEQVLDMRNGMLHRKLRFKDKKDRKTRVNTRCIVSMDDPHTAAMEYCITPENYSGKITVRTELDGTVINWGVKRYRQLNSKHWKPVSQGTFSGNV